MMKRLFLVGLTVGCLLMIAPLRASTSKSASHSVSSGTYGVYATYLCGGSCSMLRMVVTIEFDGGSPCPYWGNSVCSSYTDTGDVATASLDVFGTLSYSQNVAGTMYAWVDYYVDGQYDGTASLSRAWP